MVVGRNNMSYFYDSESPTENLSVTKIRISSTIVDTRKRANFMSDDIKDFFLALTMKQDEYMKEKYKYISKAIEECYEL